MVVKREPSLMVWLGMSETTGASLTLVTVKVAGSLSDNRPGSVAVNVIVSEPNQSAFGIVIVATRLISMLTVNSVLPEKVQFISESRLSTSET